MIRLSLFDYFFEKKIKEIRDILALYTYNNNNHVRSCRLDIFIKKMIAFLFQLDK